jgi:uncharacterized protein (DUF58 family)
VNQRGWFLGGLAFVLMLAAMITLRGELAALALPPLAYLAAAVFGRPERPHIKVERSLSAGHVAYQKSLTVRVWIENQGEDLDEVYLRDDLGDLLPSAGQAAWLLALPAGIRIEREYTLSTGRGEINLTSLHMLASDHTGLLPQYALLPAPGRMLIFPRVNLLRRIPIRPPKTRGFAGSIPSRMPGSGVDFYGVREYQPGDPPRRINWRVSARSLDDLFTNEFEQERNADVGLILDARLPVYGPAANNKTGELFEASVQAAAALAKAFLDDGNRLSLLVYGESMGRVFPGYGKLQMDRILRTLARAQPGFNYALESLKYLPTRLFPAGSQLVIVSPLSPNDIHFFRRLRSQGYSLLLIVPDPLGYEAGDFPPSTEKAYALRLARIQRRLLLRALDGLSVQVVDWNIAQSLDKTLGRAMLRTRLLRRATFTHRIGMIL